MRPLFRHRLEIRLVVTVGMGLLVFALFAGMFTYAQAYRQQLKSALDMQRQLVATVQTQAEVAVFAEDNLVADGVVAGLLASPIIAAVRIESLRGDFGSEPGSTAGNQDFAYPLFSPIDSQKQIGSLIIVQNDRHVDGMAADAAVYQTMLLLVQILLAALIMAVFLRIMMVNPITRLTKVLAAIRPGSTQRVTIEAAHTADQIGQLSMSANTLLDATENAMAEVSRTNASLEQALAKLTEKEQAKSNFFAAASHDLRQPIHAMRLFLDALKRVDGKEERAKLIESIEASSQSLNELLEGLLDISKLDAGAVVPELQPVRLDDLFARLDTNFSALALKRKLRFKLWFPPQPLTLLTDKRLLNVILANLTGNALKNTAQGGVLVGFRRRGNRCVFQVRDTGVGIDAAHLQRIYEEFYQIDNPNRDRAKGLGLGLAIARRVSRLLGYTLECRSQVGRGTVFEVGMPLSILRAPEVGKAAAIVGSASDSGRFSGKRVVVLEDDAMVASALAEWLVALGCRVSVFARAEAALAEVTTGSADYYLVDYQLAGKMNGLEFLEAVRQQRSGTVRAVVVSGNTSPRFIEAAESVRWPILFKPADPLQILASLEPGVQGVSHDRRPASADFYP